MTHPQVSDTHSRALAPNPRANGGDPRPPLGSPPTLSRRLLRPSIVERVVANRARATWEAARTIHSEQAS